MKYHVTIVINKDMSTSTLTQMIKTMLLNKFYPEFIASTIKVEKVEEDNENAT